MPAIRSNGVSVVSTGRIVQRNRNVFAIWASAVPRRAVRELQVAFQRNAQIQVANTN
jgi:hypothetical protein